MTTPSQKRLHDIIRDSVANQASDRASFERDVAREDLVQTVDKALRESGIVPGEQTRQAAKIAVQAVDEFQSRAN